MEPPTVLSRKALDEFKTIYREEFNEEISDTQAEEMGIRLLRLFDLLARSSAPECEKQGMPPSTLTYGPPVR